MCGVEGRRPRGYCCPLHVGKHPPLRCFSKEAPYDHSRRFSQYGNCFLFEIFIPASEINSEHRSFHFSHTIEIVTVSPQDAWANCSRMSVHSVARDYWPKDINSWFYKYPFNFVFVEEVCVLFLHAGGWGFLWGTFFALHLVFWDQSLTELGRYQFNKTG